MKPYAESLQKEYLEIYPDGKIEFCRHVVEGEERPNYNIRFGHHWTLFMCKACYGAILLDIMNEYFSQGGIKLPEHISEKLREAVEKSTGTTKDN